MQERALLVGAITRDFIASSSRAVDTGRCRPGGVVFHAGRALARLGARVRVVTRLCEDDAGELLGPLQAERIETRGLPSRATTTYLLDYSGAVDRHELREMSDTITPEDIPEAWRDADLVQLGPLHRSDLLPETTAVVRGLVGLDVQGLLREPGPDGTCIRPFRALAAFLEHVDVVQVSEHDLPAFLEGADPESFARRHGLGELIVTRGARGASVITPGRTAEIPATPASGSGVVGAGDVFLASYLLLRARDRGPLEAARGAARVCAAKLEHGEVPKGLDPESLVP